LTASEDGIVEVIPRDNNTIHKQLDPEAPQGEKRMRRVHTLKVEAPAAD
jgi:hypothetical protein